MFFKKFFILRNATLWLMCFLFFAFQSTLYAANKSLTILYTNDMHAHLFPRVESRVSSTRKVGGFANLATLVKSFKKESDTTIYLDAGDYFSGPYIGPLTRGRAVIESMNLLGLDATCIGNHEFDYGWENMLSQFERAEFPIFNGNIFFEGTDDLFWENPYAIIKKGNVNIGVIGLIGEFAFYNAVNSKMVKGLEARDEQRYLQKYISELRPVTDLVVLIVHHGVPRRQLNEGMSNVERNLYSDLMLAKNVDGLDVIVSGHMHQGTSDALVSNGTVIVSTNAYTSELGKLDIQIDTTKGQITSYSNKLINIFDDEIKDDPAMVSEIGHWKKEVQGFADRRLAISKRKLVRAYDKESNMGNLFADALLQYDLSIDLALLNSGSLRQNIDEGPVTKGDLVSTFPFPNKLVLVKLKGSRLRAIFDHAAKMTNGVLQVSRGTRYSFEAGKGVQEISINGRMLEDEKLYWVATSDFVVEGGDGYSEFDHSVQRVDTGKKIVDLVEDFLVQERIYYPVYEERLVIK